MSKGARILVIDDERSIRKLLEISLSAEGYEVIPTKTGKEGLLEAANHNPDVVILDLGLPDIPGLDVLKKLKSKASTPVIILTVKDADAEKVALLDAGADDYLTKPFSVDELVARIRVALRHSVNLQEEPVFTRGKLAIDFNLRTVKVGNELVKLTAKEFDLLKCLVGNTGKIVTQKQLLKEVWGMESPENSHYLRIFFGHLRKKLEKFSLSGIIITEPGVGYRLNI
jgi:two-component system, OmpR family, KDP operon response regulator KdpE